MSFPYRGLPYSTLIQGQNHLGDGKIFMIYGTCLMVPFSANCSISSPPFHVSLNSGSVLQPTQELFPLGKDHAVLCFSWTLPLEDLWRRGCVNGTGAALKRGEGGGI